MQDKQIWDLTADDLREFGVWYFPMDESAEDECTIRPCLEESDLAVIVRAVFFCADETRYLGYVHWSQVDNIGYRQPTVFLNDGTVISFWNGIVKPTWSETSAEAKRMSFSITFESEPLLGFSSISGQLEGMYYLEPYVQIACLSTGEA